MKCNTPHCSRQTQPGKRKCPRCRLRAWRKKHPICAKWLTHLSHAKKRGIPVEWSKLEFASWCVMTGYHLLDGYEIHRLGDKGGYSFNNCACIPKSENARMGGIKGYARLHEKRLAMLRNTTLNHFAGNSAGTT